MRLGVSSNGNLTDRKSNEFQMSVYALRRDLDKLKVARPPGLEPGTSCLEGTCTIQLCYGRSRAAQNGREARILHQAGGACAL